MIWQYYTNNISKDAVTSITRSPKHQCRIQKEPMHVRCGNRVLCWTLIDRWKQEVRPGSLEETTSRAHAKHCYPPLLSKHQKIRRGMLKLWQCSYKCTAWPVTIFEKKINPVIWSATARCISQIVSVEKHQTVSSQRALNGMFHNKLVLNTTLRPLVKLTTWTIVTGMVYQFMATTLRTIIFILHYTSYRETGRYT